MSPGRDFPCDQRTVRKQLLAGLRRIESGDCLQLFLCERLGVDRRGFPFEIRTTRSECQRLLVNGSRNLLLEVRGGLDELGLQTLCQTGQDVVIPVGGVDSRNRFASSCKVRFGNFLRPERH